MFCEHGNCQSTESVLPPHDRCSAAAKLLRLQVFTRPVAMREFRRHSIAVSSDRFETIRKSASRWFDSIPGHYLMRTRSRIKSNSIDWIPGSGC